VLRVSIGHVDRHEDLADEVIVADLHLLKEPRVLL
jgi:hypothetical protein